MAVNDAGSPKPVKGRTKYGATSKKRRSSKARSSISGGSWDQSSLPLSLRQASFNTATRAPSAATGGHDPKVRLSRPPVQHGASRVLLAFSQSSEQGRPFDAFVNAPSPFAKQRATAKTKAYAKSDGKVDTKLTTTSNSRNQSYHTSPSSTPPPSPPPSPSHDSVNEIDFTPDTNMYSNRTPPRVEGYLDARTRAANLQHTRPEWTTWDFVDLFLTSLPPGTRTVDLWNNFKEEGEVDTIDIFVTRGGQKDTKARLRFRQVLSDFNFCVTNQPPGRRLNGISSHLQIDTLSIYKKAGHGRSTSTSIEIRRRRSRSQAP